MNKRQLIDDIRTYNASAAPQFLAQFDEAALGQYLSHLEASKKRHVVISRVIRAPQVASGRAELARAA